MPCPALLFYSCINSLLYPSKLLIVCWKNSRKPKRMFEKSWGGKLLKLHSEKMIKKGKREGRKEGEGCLALLMSLLLKSGKAEEAAAASESEQFREELYKNDGQLRFFPRMPHATWLIADIESIKVNLC